MCDDGRPREPVLHKSVNSPNPTMIDRVRVPPPSLRAMQMLRAVHPELRVLGPSLRRRTAVRVRSCRGKTPLPRSRSPRLLALLLPAHGLASLGGVLGVAVEDEARVRAAEAKGVGHDTVHLALVALREDVHAFGLLNELVDVCALSEESVLQHQQ
jgi:hypothetical protein